MINKTLYFDSYVVNFIEGDSALFRERFRIEKDINDSEYIVKQGDTLNTIAFGFYRDSKLWYVIADVNDIQNPFELTIGMSLRIPPITRINNV